MTAHALPEAGHHAKTSRITKELFTLLLSICIIPIGVLRKLTQLIHNSSESYWYIPEKLNIIHHPCSICGRQEIVIPASCICHPKHVLGECPSCFSAFCDACGEEDCASWMKCSVCAQWFSIPEIMYIVLSKHQEYFGDDEDNMTSVWDHLLRVIGLHIKYRNNVQILWTVSNLVPFQAMPLVLGGLSEGTLGLAYDPKATLRPCASP